jgi:rusticyanin
MKVVSDNLPSEDPDMRYAQGLMDRDTYMGRREEAPEEGPKRRPPIRRKSLVLLAVLSTVLVIVILIIVIAVLPTIQSSSPISFSTPNRISQVELNATAASEGAVTSFSVNNTIWIGSGVSRVVVLASPLGHDETFVILGLTNPTIHLSRESKLTITLVNADQGGYHNLALTTRQPPYTQMPMMQTMNMPGSAMLSPPESNNYWAQEMRINTLTPGQYWYLCEYPGHAGQGMYGSFIVD